MSKEDTIRSIINELIDQEGGHDTRAALIQSYAKILNALQKAYEAGASEVEQTLES